MDWFFAESVDGEHLITGEDAIHITKSLRKSVGEAVTPVSYTHLTLPTIA